MTSNEAARIFLSNRDLLRAVIDLAESPVSDETFAEKAWTLARTAVIEGGKGAEGIDAAADEVDWVAVRSSVRA